MAHIPVLLDETIASLELQPGLTVVDGTVGNGGHALHIIPLIPGGVYIGIDQDQTALDEAKRTLSDHGDITLHLVHGNSRNIQNLARGTGISHADRVLLDVGLRSDQIDNPDRGFSFQNDGPLDMRMDQSVDFSAADIVNTWKEETIADLIYVYGDERAARKIASVIVARRAVAPFETTLDLATVIKETVKGYSRIHPATKTFQALRIVVNDELAALREALQSSWELLGSGGRMSVISFHSGEDALVKSFMREKAQEGVGEVVYKKPIIPTPEESARNPRARSSKLRTLIKLS